MRPSSFSEGSEVIALNAFLKSSFSIPSILSIVIALIEVSSIIVWLIEKVKISSSSYLFTVVYLSFNT